MQRLVCVLIKKDCQRFAFHTFDRLGKMEHRLHLWDPTAAALLGSLQRDAVIAFQLFAHRLFVRTRHAPVRQHRHNARGAKLNGLLYNRFKFIACLLYTSRCV